MNGQDQYDEAVRKLNTLQNVKKETKDAENLVLMQKLLDRVSITQADLKKLKIIHISGTKGKGSTCAFIESILRHHGYKTGFFSSPHMIEVRERFRINGVPISKSEFARHFEGIYQKLEESADQYEIGIPKYFYVLTTMAFHVFLEQEVNVAIMEVGLGGAYDCTNVVESPIVCGVTSFGYDHTSILGNTIESIAWQKAGIFKPGAPAFTSPQVPAALEVLCDSARKAKIMLRVSPDLSSYPTENGQPVQLGLAGDHQRQNASLALQISEFWMKRRVESAGEPGHMSEDQPSPADPFLLTTSHLRALKECKWYGRSQVMKFKNLTFYLDGAHTAESMEFCAKWFKDAASQEEEELGRECVRILAFNVTRKRNPKALFEKLMDCNLSDAVFTPNIATYKSDRFPDQKELRISVEQQIAPSLKNREVWLETRLCARNVDVYSEADLNATVFPYIANAVAWLSQGRDEGLYQRAADMRSHGESGVPRIPESKHIQVLVTGSLILVGDYLGILDPGMNE